MEAARLVAGELVAGEFDEFAATAPSPWRLYVYGMWGVRP